MNLLQIYEKVSVSMKDRFEAKLMLFIIPALAVWELLYQLVIIKLFPAAQNDTIHGVGFVVCVAAVWLIYRRYEGFEREEDDQDA